MPTGLVNSSTGLTFNQSMIIIFVAIIVMLIAAAVAGYYILTPFIKSSINDIRGAGINFAREIKAA
jgi:hypothetical protein